MEYPIPNPSGNQMLSLVNELYQRSSGMCRAGAGPYGIGVSVVEDTPIDVFFTFDPDPVLNCKILPEEIPEYTVGVIGSWSGERKYLSREEVGQLTSPERSGPYRALRQPQLPGDVAYAPFRHEPQLQHPAVILRHPADDLHQRPELPAVRRNRLPFRQLLAGVFPFVPPQHIQRRGLDHHQKPRGQPLVRAVPQLVIVADELHEGIVDRVLRPVLIA